ncbi:hypothetical protein FRC09_006822 [Ceratobasidium sp. 395]|nr:hypothetical protein FRC09_006822 [Ceratobasidium sp. 395]
MADITAENTAEFIDYSLGNWNNTRDDIRRAIAPGDLTSTLRFTGTALWAVEEFDGEANTLQRQIDDSACPAPALQPSSNLNQPFLALKNLVYDPQVLKLGYMGGAFGVSRLVWHNPNVFRFSNVEGPMPNASTDPAVSVGSFWDDENYPDLGMTFHLTTEPAASITFIFEGTGIAVEGLTGGSGSSFNGILDGIDPAKPDTTRSGFRHRSILYQEDGLEYKTHNSTLVNGNGYFQNRPKLPAETVNDQLDLPAGHNHAAESDGWDIPPGQNHEAREAPNVVSEAGAGEAPRPRNWQLNIALARCYEPRASALSSSSLAASLSPGLSFNT